MRVLLFLGFAFEVWQIASSAGWSSGSSASCNGRPAAPRARAPFAALECAISAAVSGSRTDHPRHTHRFDIEAFGLHHSEDLLNRPALAVKPGDPACICEVTTACVVSNRQCTGVTASGGSTSRASTKVSVTFSGSFAASAEVALRPHQRDLPRRSASTTLRASSRIGRQINRLAARSATSSSIHASCHFLLDAVMVARITSSVSAGRQAIPHNITFPVGTRYAGRSAPSTRRAMVAPASDALFLPTSAQPLLASHCSEPASQASNAITHIHRYHGCRFKLRCRHRRAACGSHARICAPRPIRRARAAVAIISSVSPPITQTA